MIDLCTRKSSKIQDDTSQYKCSASVPVPTGSHWILIGMKLPGLTDARFPSFPPASMACFIQFSAVIIPLPTSTEKKNMIGGPVRKGKTQDREVEGLEE